MQLYKARNFDCACYTEMLIIQYCMAKTVQKNFRMSEKARDILTNVALRTGLSETEIIELCVAAHALEIGVEAERANALLYERLTKKRGGNNGKH